MSKKTGGVIKSVAIGGVAVPGLRKMVQAHTDTQGREWPAGTEYMIGHAGGDSQTVSIKGRQIVFSKP